MMSETSAGRAGHETSATGSLSAATAATTTTSSITKTSGSLSHWRVFAIEYKTAIAASIGASISAVVGYPNLWTNVLTWIDSPLV